MMKEIPLRQVLKETFVEDVVMSHKIFIHFVVVFTNALPIFHGFVVIFYSNFQIVVDVRERPCLGVVYHEVPFFIGKWAANILYFVLFTWIICVGVESWLVCYTSCV